jgi:hypothetical protein
VVLQREQGWQQQQGKMFWVAGVAQEVPAKMEELDQVAAMVAPVD